MALRPPARTLDAGPSDLPGPASLATSGSGPSPAPEPTECHPGLPSVFPVVDDLPAALAAARRLDYAQLCAFDTHHGRGYSGQFWALRNEACREAKDEMAHWQMHARARGIGLWRRGLNCYYTWLRMAPDRGGSRELDTTCFGGIPLCAADGHTLEGKRSGRLRTVVSGDYDTHLQLGLRVSAEGWAPLRDEVHSEPVFEVTSPTLF